MRPPRWARALLALVATPESRAFMLDDLDEEFAARAAADGPRAAVRWYRVQVITSLAPALGQRLRRRRHADRLHARQGLFMDTLTQDLRFALRSFRRRPGFTFVALATLSAGIAANTAIFSVANGVLLKGIAGVSEDGRAVEIAGGSGDRFTALPYPLVREMAARASSLESVAALDWSPFSVGGGDRPEIRLGAAVTFGYFDVLGVHASRGRLFTAEDAFWPFVRPVAVISERLRAERFAGAEIPGASLVVNGTSLTIVGVAADGFRGHALTPMDVFVPLGLQIPGTTSEQALSSPDALAVEVLGKRRTGVSPEAAAEELTALARTSLAAAGAELAADFAVRVDDWSGIPAPARPAVTAFLGVLLLLTSLLLALACVNVAGMMLSRSVERGDEIALRMAMGAQRSRIVRQLLSEATLLALAAGALALPLSGVMTRLLLAFEPPLPVGFDLALAFGLDGRVLAFCFSAAVSSTLLFNLAPAVGASRTDVIAAINGSSGAGVRTRTRVRGLLVAGQMGFALVLLATAGLFVRALSSAKGMDTGWNAEGVWTADLDLELTGTSEDEGRALYAELTRTLAASPGVRSVALAHQLPLGGMSSFGDVLVEGLEPPTGRDGFEAFVNRVSPGYFRTLELGLLQGRAFTEGDVEGAPDVAVVNRTMASRLWAEGDPIGEVFRVVRRGAAALSPTVVGVVEDARYGSLFETTPSVYYLPIHQSYSAHVALLVRPEAGRSDEVSERVAGLLGSLLPALPRNPIAPLPATLSLALTPQRLGAWIGGVIGLVALLLGAVGVYGVTAFAVSQRVREIGIRMALGASKRAVVAMVLGQGILAPAAGLALGLCVSFAVARLLAAFMPGIRGVDLATLAATGLTLVAVALAATFAPAWRAARSSPVASLREK